MVLLLLLSITLFGCGNTVKEVENQEYVLTAQSYNNDENNTTSSYEINGIYSGETIKKIPNGQGTFEGDINQDGTTWKYVGEFKDGTFNGQGKMFDSEGEETNIGTYTDGLFTPTDIERYTNYQKISLDGNCDIINKSKKFIQEYGNLFPCTDENLKYEAVELSDDSINYKQLIKNIDQYGDKLFTENNLIVYQIFENKYWGKTFTWILAGDIEGNAYAIIYNGSLDIYENDKIQIRALPLTSSYFDNVAGGQTNVVSVLASIVNKN